MQKTEKRKGLEKIIQRKKKKKEEEKQTQSQGKAQFENRPTFSINQQPRRVCPLSSLGFHHLTLSSRLHSLAPEPRDRQRLADVSSNKVGRLTSESSPILGPSYPRKYVAVIEICVLSAYLVLFASDDANQASVNA